jgi:hypothetical protein
MSLMFIDGSFSHAVEKRPSPGDFRVQHEFGGSVGPVDAPASLRGFGASVLATIQRPWTYARVDLVDTARGPVLMELELIEPSLFLVHAPNAAQMSADALRGAALNIDAADGARPRERDPNQRLYPRAAAPECPIAGPFSPDKDPSCLSVASSFTPASSRG